eukprot:5037208-Pleurochrysis_carterae.AAC.3
MVMTAELIKAKADLNVVDRHARAAAIAASRGGDGAVVGERVSLESEELWGAGGGKSTYARGSSRASHSHLRKERVRAPTRLRLCLDRE